MRIAATLLPLLCLTAATTATASAARVSVQAVPEKAAVKPSETVTVALVFIIQPGWHLYWQNPGETGTPPKIKWESPAGLVAAEPMFPTPKRIVAGGVTSFGYEGQLVLLQNITIPADATGKLDLAANVRWVVCSDEACESERQPLTLSIPVSDSESKTDERFAAWRAALPTVSTPPKTASAVMAAGGSHGTIDLPLDGRVGVDFFPPKSEFLAFEKPAVVDGNFRVAFRVLEGGPPAFDGVGVIMTRENYSGKTASEEIRVSYRMANSPPIPKKE